MTIAPPQGSEQAETTNKGIPIEVLIKEARQRSRRRRLGTGLSVAIIVAGVWVLASSSGHSAKPLTPVLGIDEGKSAAALAPICLTRDLRLESEGTVVGAGSWATLFLLTNISGAACSLTGYPKISLVTTSGVDRKLRIITGHTFKGGFGGGIASNRQLPTSTLRAQKVQASFWIEGTDESFTDSSGVTQKCSTAAMVLVRPPRSTRALRFATKNKSPLIYCGGFVRVLPMLPGASGTYPPTPLSTYFGHRSSQS